MDEFSDFNSALNRYSYLYKYNTENDCNEARDYFQKENNTEFDSLDLERVSSSVG